MASQTSDHDLFFEQLLLEDETYSMPLPDIEANPQLLISKVRKYYMEYIIRLLSTNYETHQKLVNKNIYLPSAIWRCAKKLEVTAAQACMVVQIYRKNIVSVIEEVKRDTKKGKLNKNLYNCLNKPPENSKKTQTPSTFINHNCQCAHSKRKRHGMSESPKNVEKQMPNLISDKATSNDDLSMSTATYVLNNTPHRPICPIPTESETVTQVTSSTSMSSIPSKRISVESQDSDELMMQLEKLFHGDTNDDNDLFDGALLYENKTETIQDEHVKINCNVVDNSLNNNYNNQDSIIENHAAQIKSLDERLASLAGLLVANDLPAQKTEVQKQRRRVSSKWLCEEYFLKQKLHDLLDQIGDRDRKELEKLKQKFEQLFGADSDDEEILSPLDETNEFIISCKERIAPWVVKLLTPYYVKGQIKGKLIFKALAKHLIRLIYQCSRYPEQYEVNSFVSDFLKNHKTIRCEADFKEFRIENI
ncbi:unnamed protein product [Spodoptera exigua]|uniref:Set2 Rpb1 interacting domain-containing protein n=1 Tax=Spodoptera exigua TaxID=7107 RepID=A0A922MV51_SPOEX|nr:hypothetical protein HF086_004326 [Spodoptera exigua]CAH0677771.1 unnamed protein product [Spodoptera exigua]